MSHPDIKTGLIRFTPDPIIFMPARYVMVFGSNCAGRHGKGAALAALRFGAKYGVGRGLSGSTYAIPTKDERLNTRNLDEIFRDIIVFNNFAHKSQDLIFMVTRLGCGLAGYKDFEIAPMFTSGPNLIFPPEWQGLVRDRNHDLIVGADGVYQRSRNRETPFK